MELLHENMDYHFNYKLYLFLNADILPNLGIDLNDIDNDITKAKVWNHWIKHGRYEERATKMINNTKTHNGRFGNLFFINMACHFISLKFNLSFEYKYKDKFNKLGIIFFNGTNQFNNFIELTDTHFMDIIHFSTKKGNLLINNNIWCQTDQLVDLIKLYYDFPFHKKVIIKANKFKDRFKKNNDLFIHIRLGDLTHKNQSLEHYYVNILNSLTWEQGYISSDSISNILCQTLITKFNLKIIDLNEEETIMFGSTCNNIILSGGTFSWLIGFFAFFSKNIYYPLIDNPWYGKIFENMPWKVIT